MSCQFCNIANALEVSNIIYQTELLCCFMDINPISEGHALIVPKKHLLEIEECDQATRLDIMNAAALLSSAQRELYEPDGITVIQNGGYYNDVNHYHMHVFPRYKNDGFGWIEPTSLQLNKNLGETASDLRRVINSEPFS